MDGSKRDAALDALRAEFSNGEHVILSTCNRVELYTAAGDAVLAPTATALTQWLARHHGVERATLDPHLIAHEDQAVVAHLFRVASSLDSLVLGEGQILGQVRDAYRAAVARGTVGPLFHGLFQRALRVGKLVREHTGLDQGRLSIASVAVELAQSVFDHFHDKTVLVIGAGKMGDLTLQHLSTLHPGRILVTNRHRDRAEAAATRWNAVMVPFERLDDALVEADLVIATTAAEQPIVGYDRYAELQRRRRGGRLALILDIAVPRDFDPRIAQLEQVWLYNVDDLRVQVERNLKQRRARIEPAEAIVARQAKACYAELLHHSHAGVLLRQLGDYGDTIAERELDRFFSTCPDLSDDQRRAAALLVHRLKNQFLHHPRSALRSVASETPMQATTTAADPHPLLSAIRHIFRLGDAISKPRRDGRVSSR
jgi:glutamyl-tRNA reductase